MNEKSKSIWKKSFKGPRGLALTFAILACAIFVVLFALGLISAKNNSTKDLLIFSSLSSIGIAAASVSVFALFRWAFCKRNLRRTLFALVCFVTAVALFYAEENWRGKHAWEKYKHEQEAKGERFDLPSIAPVPVADDQNFAMSTIVVESISAQLTNSSERARDWYGKKIAELNRTNLVNRLDMPIELQGHNLQFTNKTSGWSNAEKVDLKLWQDYYRKLATTTNFFPVASHPQTPPQDVLLALSEYDASIEELRRAGRLPKSRFPIRYTEDNPAGILLPHLAALKSWTMPLQLRAIGELQVGQTEKALADIQLMFRLTDAIRTEPLIISHLVRVAMLQIALQPVWEGLTAHNWNDTQLAALDTELAKFDFLADYSFSMHGERAFGVAILDYLRRNRQEIESMGEPETSDFSRPDEDTIYGAIAPLLDRFIPSGWFEQNKLAVARMHERYLFPIINSDTRLISLRDYQRASEACNGLGTKSTPYNTFTRLLLPALNNVSQKSARAQSSVDLARTAVALERYRLAHDTFPETLDVLAPQFVPKIPHDIFNGKPLNYRRTDNGQFILYSVGWNGTDDGGSVAMAGEKTENVDIKRGDWVWKYPAK